MCNVNQVSRAFLLSINASSDKQANMLFDEFIDGNVKLWLGYEHTQVEDPSFQNNLKALEPQLKLLRNTYHWNETVSFVKTANQVWIG